MKRKLAAGILPAVFFTMFATDNGLGREVYSSGTGDL